LNTRNIRREFSRLTQVVALCVGLLTPAIQGDAQTPPGAPRPDGYLFNDVHFHLTNYIQEGIDIRDFLKIMPESTRGVADVINRYPDRFLFGTDEVAPPDQAAYLRVYNQYAPSGRPSTGRRAKRCARVTTNASSTRRDEKCARGSRRT